MGSLKHVPLWSLGFRPFFLAGAMFACVALAVWGLWLYGHFPQAQATVGMLAWHRHEMPFGFATAIIGGFLLTAVPNWTGRPGLSGWPLLGLLLVWLAARLAWWLPIPQSGLLALQLPFLPLLVLVLGRELMAAGKRDNYPILVVLALLAGCQALTLAGIAQDDAGLQRRGALAALWLIAALMSVIGGRVIPFFIQRGLNRTNGAVGHPRQTQALLIASLLAALLIGTGFNEVPQPWLAALYALIGTLHLLRLWRWYDRGIWRVPLLWSLYLAYAWLLIAVLAMALWQLGVLPQQSLATHSLAVGGMGGLILAMIARVSLGHTGRPLKPSSAVSLGFALVLLAGVCRVFVVPFASIGLGLSVVLWCAAFAVFVQGYTRTLLTPRQ
ncbi:NnrS family protein [Pseudomonas purpurea]|uniref:NnrS family protein n=1 Tax=Pseudomonas purpurea TaxID=3136737 RepID=UPI0032657947